MALISGFPYQQLTKIDMTDTTLPITAIDLRDYFAAKAMASLIPLRSQRSEIARLAYAIADEMIAMKGLK